MDKILTVFVYLTCYYYQFNLIDSGIITLIYYTFSNRMSEWVNTG